MFVLCTFIVILKTNTQLHAHRPESLLRKSAALLLKNSLFLHSKGRQTCVLDAGHTNREQGMHFIHFNRISCTLIQILCFLFFFYLL